jgi:hypothetical protein
VKNTKHTRRKAASRKRRPQSDCVIPPPPIKQTLSNYTLSNRADERAIRDYVEGQAHGEEKVEHAEWIKTEHVFDREFDCWDVHTDKGRWWVITSPTNLYPQDLFPSLDYTLSFHVGVTARVFAAQRGAPNHAQRLRLMPVWRRWEEAAEALDMAEEAEEFQAVGMRCRECLIQLVRSVSKSSMVPAGQAEPQRSNVIAWCELIANTIAAGGSAEHIRGHLKTGSKSVWQLAGWLTHASNATRYDAAFVLEATHAVASAFGNAALRFESGSPDRCPQCGSYSISIGYNPDLKPTYLSACEKCDWSSNPPRKKAAATVH